MRDSREGYWREKTAELSSNIVQSYEEEVVRLRTELANAHAELQRRTELQARMEEDMKRALMRGKSLLHILPHSSLPFILTLWLN